MSTNNYMNMLRMRMMSIHNACEEFPVVRQPWGGQYGTTLMIELCPETFKDGTVVAAITKGRVSTDDYTPSEWVEQCCSGLVYDKHVEDQQGMLYILMHVDCAAVKPESQYPYMISGHGGGEYNVAVLLKKGNDIDTRYE